MILYEYHRILDCESQQLIVSTNVLVTKITDRANIKYLFDVRTHIKTSMELLRKYDLK
jgi:hypothetical protein